MLPYNVGGPFFVPAIPGLHGQKIKVFFHHIPWEAVNRVKTSNHEPLSFPPLLPLAFSFTKETAHPFFFSLGSSCFAPLLLWSWTWLPSACRIPPCIPSSGSCRNWWMPCRRPFNKPMMHRWGPFLQLAQSMDLSGIPPWKFVLTMGTQQHSGEWFLFLIGNRFGLQQFETTD